MPVDPQAHELLRRMTAFEEALPPGPDDEVQAVIAARDGFDRQSYELMGGAESMGLIRDLAAPGPHGPIRLRAYDPALPADPAATARPVVLYLHGGGWIEGSLDSHDRLCRALSNGSDAIVVAVEYRLAPEHPFPAAGEDCWAALDWLQEQAGQLGGDPGRLAVAGDSAGGNLAAVLARRARDEGGPPLRLQVLLYPATDAAMDTPSYAELSEGFGLTRAAMELSWRLYLGDHNRRDPDASPLCAGDLSGLAPALVLTCEYDVLRDEGLRYAARLAEAGVGTREIRCDGLTHGFLRWRGAIDAAHDVLQEVCGGMREALAAPEATPA